MLDTNHRMVKTNISVLKSQNKYTGKAVRGSAFVFISVMISAIVGYGLRLFLSRSLAVDEFGLLYAVMAFFALFALFRDFGLNHAVVKYLPEFLVKKRKDKIKATITFNIVFQMVLGLIIVLPIMLFSDYIAISYFHTIEASLALKIFGVMFLIGVFTGVFQSCLQGFNRIGYYSIIQPFSTITTLVSVLALAYLGFLGAVLGFFVTAIVATVAAFVLMLKVFPEFFKIKGKIDSKLGRDLLMFSFPVFLGFIGGYVLGYTDTLVLTYFRSLEEVAYYQVAWATTQVLWIIGSVVSTVMFPIVSEINARRQKKLLPDGIKLLTKFSFIVVLPFCLISIAFSDFIITFLFGVNYLPASAVLQILSIHAVFYTLWVVFSTTLIGLGKPGLNTKIVIGVSIFNLVGNILFVPTFGVIGAAMVTTISFVAAFLLSFFALRKDIDIKFPVVDSIKAVIGALLMLGIIFFLKQVFVLGAVLETIILLLIGLVFYTLYILLTKTVSKKEVQMVLYSGLPIPKFVAKLLIRLSR